MGSLGDIILLKKQTNKTQIIIIRVHIKFNIYIMIL